MGSPKNREIRLNRRPLGLPEAGDFELLESQIPTPAPGQVLVRNLIMSVDPYMRGRMNDRRSYVEPFQIGETLQGAAVGKIVSSNGNVHFAAGDHVLSQCGWREWFATDGRDLVKLPDMPSWPDGSKVGIQACLGALGMPGLTAYAGMLRIGEVKTEDRVFVSTAAGAVGSVACQIARAKGCELVVGSAGSEEKCNYLQRELDVDAINHREADDLSAALARAMPGGIDLYFDNVGGSHLEAALDNMRDNGRIVVCGMIEQYNATEPPRAPRNLINLLTRRLTMRAFIVIDHFDLREQFFADMAQWIAEGKMTWRETVVDGLERAPEALIGLFRGDNLGKMLVKLAEDDV